MCATIEIPERIFKKTKIKANHEGVRLKVVETRALEREVGGARAGASKESAMTPQLRFLAMNRAQRAKSFLAESNQVRRLDEWVLLQHRISA